MCNIPKSGQVYIPVNRENDEMKVVVFSLRLINARTTTKKEKRS
jgi:hypothetical protein